MQSFGKRRAIRELSLFQKLSAAILFVGYSVILSLFFQYWRINMKINSGRIFSHKSGTVISGQPVIQPNIKPDHIDQFLNHQIDPSFYQQTNLFFTSLAVSLAVVMTVWYLVQSKNHMNVKSNFSSNFILFFFWMTIWVFTEIAFNYSIGGELIIGYYIESYWMLPNIYLVFVFLPLGICLYGITCLRRFFRIKFLYSFLVLPVVFLFSILITEVVSVPPKRVNEFINKIYYQWEQYDEKQDTFEIEQIEYE